LVRVHILSNYLARENKSIEIWTVPYSWSQIAVIAGNQNCDIRSLHWLEPEADTAPGAKDPNPLYYRTQSGKFKKRRLVSTGLNGQVIEWNIQTQMPRAKYNAHAAIWDSKMHGKYIYLACEDGSVKILKVKKTKIEYVRQLVKSDSKALSIELVRSGVDEKSLVKSLFVGYADSSIRKWDLLTGNSVLHFEKLTKKAQKKVGLCFIWQLKLFKGFLISGDSQGDITVWDAEFGTLVKQFK
jgi:U3 small nucleolar RNA-associated protein 4